MKTDFLSDKQTLTDLNVTGKYTDRSLYSLFDCTLTRGGEHRMEQMFLNPLTDAEQINRRTDVFRRFETLHTEFPFDDTGVQTAAQYLGSQASTPVTAWSHTVQLKLSALAMNSKAYESLCTEISATVEVLKTAHAFFRQIAPQLSGSELQESMGQAIETLDSIQPEKIICSAQLKDVVRTEQILRGHHRENLVALIDLIYRIDVAMAVASVGREYRFCYAQAATDDANIVEIRGCYHPHIPNAVANDIVLNCQANVLFLTGANMAGKSTFMKSFGTAIYLAHMGFPVAATSMRFIPRRGIYTSINVPDNLALGYSHFYAEVRRVKFIAEQVVNSGNLIVMFDELFKGTNVKDAYEATVAVTESFSKHRDSLFVVSTHIMEAGQTLQESASGILFNYLPTVLESQGPRYTYRLTPGITADRFGMQIIRNEKILEIIRVSNTARTKMTPLSRT